MDSESKTNSLSGVKTEPMHPIFKRNIATRLATIMVCAGICVMLGACRTASGAPVEKMGKIVTIQDGAVTLAMGTMVMAPQGNDAPIPAERWKCVWPHKRQTKAPVLCEQFVDSGETLTVALSDVNVFTQQEQSSLQIGANELRVGDVLLLGYECDGTLGAVMRLQWPKDDQIQTRR